MLCPMQHTYAVLMTPVVPVPGRQYTALPFYIMKIAVRM